jgi:hypothetical protein
MTTSDLWCAVARIRHVDLDARDRELLRPVFASFDNGEVRHIPPLVVKRIRDIDARMPK